MLSSADCARTLAASAPQFLGWRRLQGTSRSSRSSSTGCGSAVLREDTMRARCLLLSQRQLDYEGVSPKCEEPISGGELF